MSISSETMTERLVRDNQEFKRLFEKHRRFEERLDTLNTLHHPSDEEKLESITLKKHKLALKDRMAEIARLVAGAPAER